MAVLESIYNFIYQYFIHPIKYATGYNIINTTAYALLFIFLVDSTQKTIEKLKISMNRFLKAFVPYVLLGGVMRVLTDAKIYPQDFVFVTPGIYLLMLALTFVDAYFQIPLGWLLLAVNLSEIVFRTNAYLLVLFFAFMTTVFSITVLRIIKIKVNYLIILIFFAHMLDAASTYVAVDIFNYGEQHVLANFFMNISQTAAVMFPLKMIVLMIIVKFFEEIKDPDTRAFLYWVVAAIGIGPGIRNTLMATMGL
jgi:uncharacterized membrane protein